MNAGTLDQKVSIRLPWTNRTRSGAAEEKFTLLATVWGSFKPSQGAERWATHQKYSEADAIFGFRWRKLLEQVDARARLVHGGREYDVLGILRIPGGRPERLEVLARARTDGGTL